MERKKWIESKPKELTLKFVAAEEKEQLHSLAFAIRTSLGDAFGYNNLDSKYLEPSGLPALVSALKRDETNGNYIVKLFKQVDFITGFYDKNVSGFAASIPIKLERSHIDSFKNGVVAILEFKARLWENLATEQTLGNREIINNEMPAIKNSLKKCVESVRDMNSFLEDSRSRQSSLETSDIKKSY